MRLMLIFFPVLFLFVACGAGDGDKGVTVKTGEVLPGPDQAEITDEEAIATVRAFYGETTAKLEAGAFKKDSIEYTCEDAMHDGIIRMYSDAGGVVMVENSFSRGDHFGQTDRWYFKDGELAFLFQNAGGWQFGGPMTTDEDGNEYPGTIDDITENRYYFNDGALVKHLTKEYRIESSGDKVNPDDIPNETMTHNGKTPDGYNFIAAVMATRTVDCGMLE